MNNLLNSWNPQVLGPARTALHFWAGAQMEKLLLCCQKRVHIHILVTLLYKEYWNTALYLQNSTSLKMGKKQSVFEKGRDLARLERKGRGRLKIHLSVMWERGDFISTMTSIHFRCGAPIMRLNTAHGNWIVPLESLSTSSLAVWHPSPSKSIAA